MIANQPQMESNENDEQLSSTRFNNEILRNSTLIHDENYLSSERLLEESDNMLSSMDNNLGSS